MNLVEVSLKHTLISWGSSRTKWYGQNGRVTNGTDKIINPSLSHWRCDFFINPLSVYDLFGTFGD